MGTVFVVVDGQHGDNAENFYRMSPAESVLPNPQILQIGNVVRVSPPSLSTLLQAIIVSRDREIIVVSHGSPTQLAMRVIPRINLGVDLNFINIILGPDSNASIARRIRTTEQNIETLRSRIQNVQQLRLNRLEFRACRVGHSEPTLEALKRLFRASSACAPCAFDGYGRIRNTRPTTDAASITQWQSAHRGYQTFGTSPNRFFWVNNGSVDPPVISDVFAESWQGVRSWVEAKFPSGTNHTFTQGTFYYHIQTNLSPTSGSVHGSRTFDNNFVFPNDSGYRQNLVRIQSSPATRHSSLPQMRHTGRGPIGLDNTCYASVNKSANSVTISPLQGLYRLPGPENQFV